MTRRLVVVLLSATALLTAGCSTSTPDLATTRPERVEAEPVRTEGPPGPETTGVPSGITLRPSGALDITRDGTVIDGLDIDGCVTVRASDVTIQNSRIRCADPATGNVVQTTDGVRRLLVQDTEIDGLGTADIGVGWGHYTLVRVNIHSTNDGARLGDEVRVEDSWIHDLVRQGELHPDCLQATQGDGIVIRGNVLDAYNESTGDLNNAAIMLGSETGPRRLQNVLVEGNVLNGGNYTVNIRGDATIDNIEFRDNTYGPDSRYGPVRAPADVDFQSESMVESDQTWSIEASD